MLDFGNVLGEIALYLVVYVGALATILQAVISHLKPIFLHPLRDRWKLDEQRYLIFILVTRAVITVFAFFTVWGGTEAAVAAFPTLPDGFVLPELGIAIGTIILIIVGEEVINPLVEALYAGKDAAKTVGGILEGDEKTTTDQPAAPLG